MTKRCRQVLLLFMAFGLLSLNACTLLNSRSTKEIITMAAEDGDRELREPMRDIRGTTRVVIFALDGAGHESFIQAVQSGRMPRVADFLGSAPVVEEGVDSRVDRDPYDDEPYADDAHAEDQRIFAHAYAAPDVLSTLPSSTMPAWASIFTGSPPAETGIPGNEWFDRDNMSFQAPSPVTTDRRYQVFGSYNEDRLGDLIRVPTLFERAEVRSHVSLLPIYRGADLLGVPEVEPFGTLFNAALLDVLGADSSKYRVYEKLDQVSIKSLNESLYRYGWADLQVVYLPGIDMFTHIAPSPVEDQQRYLSEVIDPAVGDVLDLYEACGLLDQTYVLFVSDHGHTAVLSEDDNSLWREGDEEPSALLRKAGFRIRPRALKTDGDEDDFQGVLAMQGGMANVYLADRSTCAEGGMRCDWSRPPRFEEDVMAAVRAFDEANRTGAHIPALKGTLDLILARPDAVAGSEEPFQVYDGERLMPIDSYLARSPRPDLLDLPGRLEDLAVGRYGYLAGDILLLSRMRLDDPIERRTYFGEPYHSWHGSPNRQDSRVAFVLAHAKKEGTALRRMVRDALGSRPSQMAVTPLVLELLGR